LVRRIILAAAMCLCLAVSCLAADYTVSRVSTDCTVNRDGSCTMSQRMVLEVKEPLKELTVPAGTDVRDISVSGAAGRVFHEAGGSYVRLDFDTPFSGELELTVRYTVPAAVETQKEREVLSCRLMDSLWETEVERYSFSVVLPEKLSRTPVFSSGYRGQDVQDVLTLATQGTALSGVVRGGLLDREAFAMMLTVPAGYFDLPERLPTDVGTWILLGLMVILVGLGIWYWASTLRSGRLHVQARTMPPESISPGELRFVLCGARPSFGLLVCHWAQLGYLHISVNQAGRILLRKNTDMGSERRDEEKKLFDLLFGTADVCEACGSRYLRAAEKAGKALSRHWYRRLFDPKTGSELILRVIAAAVCGLALLTTMRGLLPESGLRWLLLAVSFAAGGAMGIAVSVSVGRIMIRDWKWCAAGAVSFGVLFFLGRFGGGMAGVLLGLSAALAAGLATAHGGKRTPEGTDILERSIGFCRFLHHGEESHLCRLLQRDSQYFYTVMLYAAGCGVGRKFARSFGDIRLESCPWLTLPSKTPTRAYPYYLRFEALLRRLDRE